MELPHLKNKISSKNLMENTVVFSVLAVACLLAFVLLWADYVFYKVNFKNGETGSITPPEDILNEKDIEEVVKLLDVRAAKFQQIFLQK